MEDRITYGFNNKQENIINELPVVNDVSGVYLYTTQSQLDHEFIAILDQLIGIGDTLLSKWLNITPRTLRNYKNKKELILKENIKEHIVLILSLYKHGITVFEDVKGFEEWLSSKNPFLDNMSPSEFLNTSSGVKLIDDRLTAMEFGGNV